MNINLGQPFLALIFFIETLAAQDTVQHVIAGRQNEDSQEKKPYVILISADGFRFDLAEKYHAKNLLRLRDSGVSADYMESSYPSLTFPNHYTIITGLYPAHHGIVDNTFFDRKKNQQYAIRLRPAVLDSSWYGGTPLWVLAEKQHMLSACFYWVASESAIQGVRPTYYYTFNDIIPMDERIKTVKEWLQLPPEKRPHFITFYFPQVDHQEHLFGPDSKEAIEAVQFVDENVGRLVQAVDSLHLAVNFIFLSDHGMIKVDNQSTLNLPDQVDTSEFKVLPGTALLHLYAKNPQYIQPTFVALRHAARDYDVFLTTSMPEKWHYSKKDDFYDRLGDIILVPHLPKVFNIGNGRVPLGEHGFDPAIPEMRATFYAWGPAFARNRKIRGFENIDVYPLIAKILGLTVTDKIDGGLDILNDALAK